MEGYPPFLCFLTDLKGMWNDSTVKVIFPREVYIGHMVQGKDGIVCSSRITK